MRFLILFFTVFYANHAWSDDLSNVRAYISHMQRARRPSVRSSALALAPLLVEISEAQNVPVLLVAVTAKKESNFGELMHGKRGEFGVMQVMRLNKTADIREQIIRGVKHLARSIQMCGSILHGINHYMSGDCKPLFSRPRSRYKHYIWAERTFNNAKR